MYSRPKIGETEEDLLKQQEEFYNKIAERVINPAAKLVNKNAKKEPTEDPKHMESIPNTSIVPEFVMGNIVERNTSTFHNTVPIPQSSKGFPQVTRRLNEKSLNSKGSIFSQQLRKKQRTEEKNLPMTLKEEVAEASYIVTGPERKEIHVENVTLLNKLSQEEILEERERLLESIDPKLIEFIQSKRKNKPKNECSKEVHGIKTEPIVQNNIDLKYNSAVSQVLSHPDSNKWLNFDNIEFEKLEWMNYVEKPPKNSEQPYEARFDFCGWLQPYIENDLTEKSRPLYHHGEEPERPGYTLQELLHLCRSTVIQQKILALNTIGNILSIYNTGAYDDVFDVPIEQIFFVVRFALDENTVPVITASLKVLRNMFYYQVDETCLDVLMGFNNGLIQPVMEFQLSDGAEKGEHVKYEELNDQQLAETDLVKCLLRTDILTRLRYIINKVKPPQETILLCLELLIRLARDSESNVETILKDRDLIDAIVFNFLPVKDPNIYTFNSNSAYGTPLLPAVKFLRVLASRNREIAVNIMKKYDILQSLVNYISADASNTDIVNLQSESMFLWATFLHYECNIEQFLMLQPFLLRILNFHVQRTDSSTNTSFAVQKHVSAVLYIIVKMIERSNFELVEPFVPLIGQGYLKWNSQVSQLESFKCGNLQILSSIYKFWSVINKEIPLNNVKMLLESKGFDLITKNIKSSSNLLCQWPLHHTKTALDSIEASVWKSNDHVIPVICTKSCMPFLEAISSYLILIDNSEIIKLFVQNKNIEEYFKLLYNSQLFLIENWFTRIESNFIINYLKLCDKIKHDLTENERMTVYSLTIKCLHIFNNEHRNDLALLFENIIFNKLFFPSEMLFKYMTLNDTVLTEAFENLNKIQDCYITSFALNQSKKHNTNLVRKNKEEGILPIDWLYLPIVEIYTKHQNSNTMNSPEDEHVQFVIIRCLQWIVIYEALFPDLTKFMKVTDRFCRLCCVFLCSNSVFLQKDVRFLLEVCLKRMVTSKEIYLLKFNDKLQGINNFQDFYTCFLDHYQGVSYGDKLFSNYILVPLMQKQNVKWRKILWSEYAAATHILYLTEEELILPSEDFLFPVETEISVIKCYQRALRFGQLKRSPFFNKSSSTSCKRI